VRNCLIFYGFNTNTLFTNQFFVSFAGMIFWIRKCRTIELLWEDMNKFGKPKNVAGS